MLQEEVNRILAGEHRKQDASHKITVARHNEIMNLIAKAREGLGESKRQTEAGPDL